MQYQAPGTLLTMRWLVPYSRLSCVFFFFFFTTAIKWNPGIWFSSIHRVDEIVILGEFSIPGPSKNNLFHFFYVDTINCTANVLKTMAILVKCLIWRVGKIILFLGTRESFLLWPVILFYHRVDPWLWCPINKGNIGTLCSLIAPKYKVNHSKINTYYPVIMKIIYSFHYFLDGFMLLFRRWGVSNWYRIHWCCAVWVINE